MDKTVESNMLNKAFEEAFAKYGEDTSPLTFFKLGAEWMKKRPLHRKLTDDEAKYLKELYVSYQESNKRNYQSGYTGCRILEFILGNTFLNVEDVPNGHVTLSFHVDRLPTSEEYGFGIGGQTDAYFLKVPESLFPPQLLEIIKKNDCNRHHLTGIAIVR